MAAVSHMQCNSLSSIQDKIINIVVAIVTAVIVGVSLHDMRPGERIRK